jgi:hypothetical protein
MSKQRKKNEKEEVLNFFIVCSPHEKNGASNVNQFP